MKYHKRIRLESRVYKIPDLPCSITICTKNKKDIFLNNRLAQDFIELLKRHSKDNNIPIYAYCVMPNHIHILMSSSKKNDIIGFVRELKSLSTRMAWEYGYHGSIWQTSFYDHFLRKGEDLKEVTTYIVQNPVRKGIAKDWRDYKFCGSLVYNL